MSQPSTKGRCQARRGPHVSMAFPGPGVAARGRALARARRGALEADLDPTDALLLRVETADQDSQEASFFAPTVNFSGALQQTPAVAHRAGLARLAAAALAVGGDSHLTQLQAPASDSRPPESALADNGTPATNATAPRTAAGEGESPTLRTEPREGESAARKLAVAEGSHLSFSKGPASDSRPPELDPADNGNQVTEGTEPPADHELRPIDLTSPGSASFAGRKGGDARSPQAALLPVGGDDITHTQEENH